MRNRPDRKVKTMVASFDIRQMGRHTGKTTQLVDKAIELTQGGTKVVFFSMSSRADANVCGMFVRKSGEGFRDIVKNIRVLVWKDWDYFIRNVMEDVEEDRYALRENKDRCIIIDEPFHPEFLKVRDKMALYCLKNQISLVAYGTETRPVSFDKMVKTDNTKSL